MPPHFLVTGSLFKNASPSFSKEKNASPFARSSSHYRVLLLVLHATCSLCLGHTWQDTIWIAVYRDGFNGESISALLDFHKQWSSLLNPPPPPPFFRRKKEEGEEEEMKGAEEEIQPSIINLWIRHWLYATLVIIWNYFFWNFECILSPQVVHLF